MTKEMPTLKKQSYTCVEITMIVDVRKHYPSGWKNSTAGMVLALQATYSGSITSIPSGPRALSGIPQH